MKNKYQRLDRQGKKEAKKRYIAFSERNKNYMSLLSRMLILGILGLIYGLGSTIFDVFVLSVPFWSYIIDAVIVIFSVFLIVQKTQIQSSTINKFLINENKNNEVVEEKIEEKEEPKEEIKEEVKEEVVVEGPKPIAKKSKHVSKNSKAYKA